MKKLFLNFTYNEEKDNAQKISFAEIFERMKAKKQEETVKNNISLADIFKIGDKKND